MTTITFDCIVQGESLPFKIDIDICKRIFELRKKVYYSLHEESAPKIEDIVLWKQQRLKTLTIEKLKILGCECEELSDTTETIKNAFKLPLKQNHTHIIVSIKIKLKCIILGETSTFPVKVNINDDVYTLKKSILKEINFPKNKDLTLWKVNVTMNDEIFEKNEEELKCKCRKLSDILETVKKKLKWIKINDINVYTKTWKAEKDEPKAYITFLHGHADRIDFHDHVFSKFSEAGIEVNAFDRRGHGRTCKEVGNPIIGGSWKDAIKDITEFIEKQNRKEGIPHYLMGHSMGGALALYYAAVCDQPLDGYIALSPLLKIVSVPLIFHVGRLFNKLLPYFVIKIDDKPEKFASNFSFSQVFVDKNFKNDKKRHLPILLMYGVGDNVSKTVAISNFYNLIEDSVEKIKENVHFGNNKSEVINYCKNWILSGGKHVESSEN
ncbi:22832_t:CDS:2, partial [Dentiscutata erythropus]